MMLLMRRGMMICALLALVTISAAAPGYEAALQVQCGTVTAVSDPVDRAVYRLVQDFGAVSARHQGRYHTGEDYFGGREMIGQPVRAIADGRVTYSAPRGWGRDGGVVIIEHTLADGRLIYSMYGHMMEADEIVFPPRYECVRMGDIVGAVGDARPAPHLHFELRVNNPDIPGPGYSWENPFSLGFRHPLRMMTNLRAWLHPAHLWHVSLVESADLAAPPLVLNDNSLIYLETPQLLKRATSDGRVLWRIALERAAVGLTGYQGMTLLHYADGWITQIDAEGAALDRWNSTVAVDSAPYPAVFPDGDALLFHAPDETGETVGSLVAFNPNRRAVLWTLADVPPVAQIHAGRAGIAVLTTDNELLTVSLDGQLLDRAQLNALPHLSTASDGSLLVYSLGGLWRIDAGGTWSFALESAPQRLGYGAALQAADGRLFVFDGARISAFANGAALWETVVGGAEVEAVSGIAGLSLEGTTLLLTTTWGHVAAFDAATGALCGDVRLYGDAFVRTLWSDLGADGVLRVAQGDQITGVDWAALRAGCG